MQEPGDNVFAGVIVYPPNGRVRVMCTRPAGRTAVILSLALRLDARHADAVGALEPDARGALHSLLRRHGFAGGDVGFRLNHADSEVSGWRLDVTIYEDGLTQHTFMTSLRRLVAKNFELLEILRASLGPSAREEGIPGDGARDPAADHHGHDHG